MSCRLPISPCTLKWSKRTISVAAILVATSLIPSLMAGQASKKHFVLPNLKLIGCKAPACSQMLPDQIAYSDAIYPWQVWVDFTDGKVIGLTAFYDQPTTIEDVQAAVDELYGKWAMADFRTGPVRLWRVEPEKFAINVSQAGSGMVQLIYLTFGAKHPMSDQTAEYLYCVERKAAKCAVRRH